ncbi:MAG: pirin family protein [Sedimentibacter sp.]|uniref:pirin family protein n=1 Tax=Sedimentibacter sp. TaxID=1960295 RepID=UPI0031589506
MKIRNVKKVVTGKKAVDGAGVRLVRVIGYNDVEDFDPFLMLDAFDSDNPDDYIKGFPWHPHRGIETVTYLINGNIEHGDSLGNKGSIVDGCCQWMTAGSGIMHQEMPKPSDRMLGTQLWLNMPKEHKMAEPKYCDITNEMVPTVTEGSNTIRVVSGDYKGNSSSVYGDYVKMLYLDVHMKGNSEWKLNLNNDETLFVYIVEGEGYFGGSDDLYESKRALLFGEGEEFAARTGENEVRFFLYASKPLKESVAWGGPIVMNTREQLNLAFRELEEGTFIKHN